MGDRFSVRVDIGGKLPMSKLEDLQMAIEADGLTFEYEGPVPSKEDLQECSKKKETLTLVGLEIDWGNIDEVFSTCMLNDLTIVQRTDGKYEYNGEIKWWKPGMKTPKETCDTDIQGLEPMASIAFLKSCLKKKMNVAKIIKTLETMVPDVPPFEIVKD